MKKVINPADGTVTFKFDIPADATEEQKAALAPVVFEVAKVAANNRAYAELHGFAARIGDAAAISKSAENGYRVTEAMRRAEVEALVAHYHSGSDQWDVRARTGGKKEVLNPTILAIAQKRGTSYEEAQAWFNAKLLAELAGE